MRSSLASASKAYSHRKQTLTLTSSSPTTAHPITHHQHCTASSAKNTWTNPINTARQECRRCQKFSRYVCDGHSEFIAIVEVMTTGTDKRKLQKQVDALEANRDCSLCFHLTTYVDESGKPTGGFILSTSSRIGHWQTSWQKTRANLLDHASRECVPNFQLLLGPPTRRLATVHLAAGKAGLSACQIRCRLSCPCQWSLSGLALSKKNAATSAMYLRLAAECQISFHSSKPRWPLRSRS